MYTVDIRRFLAAAIAPVLLLAACNHKADFRLDSLRVPVNIVFDWAADPGASPKSMTVYFYSAAGRSHIFDLKGREGGVVALPPGTYAALCHNADGDVFTLTGIDGPGTFGIRLNDHLNSGISSPDSRIAHAPDPLWVSALPEAEIPEESSGRPTLSFAMNPAVRRYTVIIRHPVNLSPAMTVTASLSGLASTVHPAKGVTGEETVTHLFAMKATAAGELTGTLPTFGHCSGQLLPSRAPGTAHTLRLHVALSGSQRWVYSRDVTAPIHEYQGENCVVELDSIVLPASGQSGSGGGFNPEIGGWQGSQETVGM